MRYALLAAAVGGGTVYVLLVAADAMRWDLFAQGAAFAGAFVLAEHVTKRVLAWALARWRARRPQRPDEPKGGGTVTYRDYMIGYTHNGANYGGTPWYYEHIGFDGPEDARCGYAESFSAALADIDGRYL